MRVKIYQPAPTPTQSGRRALRLWRVLFEGEEARDICTPFWGHQVTHPWAQVALTFKSRAAAEQYARAQGFEVVVERTAPRAFQVKSYAQNFKGHARG